MNFPLTKISRGAAALAFLSALIFTAARPVFAQTETVLYSFCSQPNCTDGGQTLAGLIMDKKGNLYGTTEYGGAKDYGAVFKLTPAGTETVLYSFCSLAACADGAYPPAGLIMDKRGNLYGTTVNGGANGSGTAFQLTPSGTETVLHSFGANATDGMFPNAGLMIDKNGNFYGTTLQGGAYTGSACQGFGCGTVFEISAAGTETVLHSFGANGTDGYNPVAVLIMDAKANLYGTTLHGGAYGYYGGTVFKLSPNGTETILHSFAKNGTDGYEPFAGVIMKKGKLYGTTLYGGANDLGTVFQLSSRGTEKVLYSFLSLADGYYPYGGLTMDAKTNLYGTTEVGGAAGGGTVFELSPSGTKTILHSFFPQNGMDGQLPMAGVIMDKMGNLYGTTYGGGSSTGSHCSGFGCGTVFKVTP